MAVPIKSNNTQQGCNPISSNCVIWQGPDIPCIKMCTGDSVSDTIAKLATELCEITSELDISLLDLSCFNPLYPTPQNFRDVMQIILDKICALENGTVDDGKANTSGCPQDCEVQIASCLQFNDNLGNNVTTLPLKDYVILIGNKICTILSDITNLQNQIDNLDVRVEALENASSGSGSLFSVNSDCVTEGTVTLQEYITALDAAFCELLGNTGTEQDYTNAAQTATACITTGSEQMANPPALIGFYENWLPNPQNAIQQIQNLWVAVCDLRTGLTNLQTQLEECCAELPPCPTSLPRCSLGLNKAQYDNFVYFNIPGVSGQSLAPNYQGVIINGEIWKVISFTGTIIPSANTDAAFNGTILIPNTGAGQSFTDYGGQDNKLLQNASILNSVVVDVSGSFLWENTVTGQQCSTNISNAGQLNPYIANCPILPSGGASSFTLTPNYTSQNTPCTSTGNITIQTSFAPVVAISGSASMVINYQLGSGAIVPLTFTNTATSLTIPNVPCGTTINFSIGSIIQNGYSGPACASTSSITVPNTQQP